MGQTIQGDEASCFYHEEKKAFSPKNSPTYIEESKLLENKDEKFKIIERIYEDKVIKFVKETIKLNEKEVSLDQFKKLIEKK